MFSLILMGDVMLGRGIDQIQRHPGNPAIADPGAKSALEFVHAAEALNGPIPRRVDPAYVWGEALKAVGDVGPSLRIANLETAITTADSPAPKPITFRMNPGNAGILSAFRIDCCVLANNHVLDWGPQGLRDTLDTLDSHAIARAGAGIDSAEAWRPAVLRRPDGGNVIVLAMADGSAGVPDAWAAGAESAGVALLQAPISRCVGQAAAAVQAVKLEGDIAVASIHWGSNWGYDVNERQLDFARRLIDDAGIDIIHGHSSHHPRQVALHRGRPIFLGCGDLINDYEGLRRYEAYRPELVAVYALEVENNLVREVRALPFRIRKFRLEHASASECEWLADQMTRQSGVLGTGWMRESDGILRLVQSR